MSSCGLFLFFQAEDGIRDLTVTGVQTCALPILIKTGTVLVHYYPTLRPGAFVEAGLGLARAEVRLDGSTTFEGGRGVPIAEGKGLGLMGAPGDDLRRGRGKDAAQNVTPPVS